MSESLNARDRLARELMRRMTPEQRYERQQQMQAEAFAQLRANPAGWERFLRRNLKKRAIRDPFAS